MVNIMNEYSSFTNKCLNNYMKLILDKRYDKYVANEFASTYINVRYSNYYNEQTIRLSINRKLEIALDDTYKRLVSEDESYEDSAKYTREFYKKVFSIDQLYLLESQKNIISDINDLRYKYFNIDDNSFNSEFGNILRDDIRKRKEFLDNFNSDTFNLDFYKLDKKNIYVKPKNNIKFPEIYSDIAIKKASEKDPVSEDLAIISFLQLCSKVVYDLISCDFDTLYFIDLPKTFFDKKNKLNRIVGVIDNPFIQDKVRIVVTFECFMRYKSYILELKRQGFIFVIYLDKSFDYCSDNIEYLEIFDKIIMENGKYYNKDMLKNDKIGDRIIRVDEVK